MSNRGWHSRGYLPHFDSGAVVQALTFRLADTLPRHVLERWRLELSALQTLTGRRSPERALRLRIEEYLDAGHGACWLRPPAIARIVQEALLHFDGQRYRLLAWTIMPNHVHVIVEVLDLPLEKLIHSWKSFTAKQINARLGRTGSVWSPDYFDRFIRDENHLAAAIEYVHQNPVRAGLAAEPAEWVFSSAQPLPLALPWLGAAADP